MTLSNGKKYKQRINSLRQSIWVNGKKVENNISKHPGFKGAISSQANLYDYQCSNKQTMSFSSKNSNERIGMSFMQPMTKEDLVKKRVMFQEWAKLNAGMMGRSPDYMNTILMALHSAADLFGLSNGQFANNIRNYYNFVSKNDLSLTHVFVKPQKNRGNQKSDETIAARMVDKTAEGIIIDGARILATQAGMTDEILVYPVGADNDNQSFAYAFAIPCDTPGLKFYCREPLSSSGSAFNHPLGSRFDEMDAVVVFDHVLVPWDRVFICEDVLIAKLLYSQSSFFEHVSHQVLSKNVIKTKMILGIIQMLIDTINIGQFQHVQEKLTEVVIVAETLNGLLMESERKADMNQWGVMTPNAQPLLAAVNYFPKVYPRLLDIIQLLGASGLVALPTEKDFDSEIGEDLNYYLQSANTEGLERVKLFRLAWDMAMSSFGSRQRLYEQFFFGDSVRLAATLYSEYDRSDAVNLAKDFMNKY